LYHYWERRTWTASPQVLRFRLRLDRFDYSIQHIPGKLMYTADTLSRAPTSEVLDRKLENGASALMEVCISQLPASKMKLGEYRTAQAADPICSTVMYYCRNGWPSKQDIDAEIAPYWKVQGNLTICDSLLLYQRRIVVPKSLQKEALSKIHAGHQGIQRCRLRARAAIWWPVLSQHIEDRMWCVRMKAPPGENHSSSQLSQNFPGKKSAHTEWD
jgi:hypothetical protein